MLEYLRVFFRMFLDFGSAFLNIFKFIPEAFSFVAESLVWIPLEFQFLIYAMIVISVMLIIIRFFI